METVRSLEGLYVLVLVISSALGEKENLKPNEIHFVSNNETSNKIYQVGVDLGIINSEKYPFSSFQRDEQNVYKDLYTAYISSNDSLPINYEEWLVMNHFGILSDTQESILQRKITKRSTADNKRQFIYTVKKGDILISTGGRSVGLIGHAAIMTTDYWVLEMPGMRQSLSDNNRQIPKDKWFDEHASDWTTVYRCPDASIAREAAEWADTHYYNPSGGEKKKITSATCSIQILGQSLQAQATVPSS